MSPDRESGSNNLTAGASPHHYTLPQSPHATPLLLSHAIAPTRRDLVVIALSALGLRLALFAATTVLAGWSLTTFANLGDGPSYLRVAANMLDRSTVVAHLDRRVFIGYPALIALVGLARVPLPAAALAVSWIASAIAAAMSAQLFGDRRIGGAMVFFPPSFLIYSSLAMSEASMLAFVVLGLYCIVRRERYVLGALALGCAGLVRPVACFAVIGVLAALIYRWRIERRDMETMQRALPRFQRRLTAAQLRPAILVAAISGAVVLAGFLALRAWRGDALEGVKIYATSQDTFAGRIIAWPFESLIMTPLRTSVPLWEVGYVWSYVTFVVVGCVLATKRLWSLRGSDNYDLVLLSAIWLFGNTAFVLCTGSVWGFHYFDRHILAALPPLLWACSDAYPRRLPSMVILGSLFVVQGFFGLLASAQ